MLKKETTYTVISPVRSFKWPNKLLLQTTIFYKGNSCNITPLTDKVNAFEDGTFDRLLVWRCNGTSPGLGNRKVESDLPNNAPLLWSKPDPALSR
jgi:hypothetical protein